MEVKLPNEPSCPSSVGWSVRWSDIISNLTHHAPIGALVFWCLQRKWHKRTELCLGGNSSNTHFALFTNSICNGWEAYLCATSSLTLGPITVAVRFASTSLFELVLVKNLYIYCSRIHLNFICEREETSSNYFVCPFLHTFIRLYNCRWLAASSRNTLYILSFKCNL